MTLLCLSFLNATESKKIEVKEKTWMNNYDKALAKAKKVKKDVYMLITSDACKWCRKLESKTLTDSYLMKKLKEKYVLLHVSRDSDFIPAEFKKKRVPRHYFLTDKGENIYTFLGYWNVPDFMSFLPEVEKKK